MSEIRCEQPFEDGTHCQEPRGHELSADRRKPEPTDPTPEGDADEHE